VLTQAAVARRGDYVVFEFTANAFLHHMVRNLVGCLVQVGKGAQSVDWVAAVLGGRDRSRAAPTFGPEGLYLTRVAYSERWNLPRFAPMLDLLAAAGP
jgi:tRNA pseudouridine38-40 synthase